MLTIAVVYWWCRMPEWVSHQGTATQIDFIKLGSTVKVMTVIEQATQEDTNNPESCSKEPSTLSNAVQLQPSSCQCLLSDSGTIHVGTCPRETGDIWHELMVWDGMVGKKGQKSTLVGQRIMCRRLFKNPPWMCGVKCKNISEDFTERSNRLKSH